MANKYGKSVRAAGAAGERSVRVYAVSDPATGDGDRSLPQLLQDLSEQATRLIKIEAQLAAREMAAKAKRGARGGALLAVAGVLGFFGAAALLTALILALAIVMPAWLAALLVGGGLVALAGALGLGGALQVRKTLPLLPAEALASVRDDIEAVREKTRSEAGRRP
ncbi:phage holin family protein [Saccharomonospora sp. NPDC006951]